MSASLGWHLLAPVTYLQNCQRNLLHSSTMTPFAPVCVDHKLQGSTVYDRCLHAAVWAAAAVSCRARGATLLEPGPGTTRRATVINALPAQSSQQRLTVKEALAPGLLRRASNPALLQWGAGLSVPQPPLSPPGKTLLTLFSLLPLPAREAPRVQLLEAPGCPQGAPREQLPEEPGPKPPTQHKHGHMWLSAQHRQRPA